MPDPDLRLEPTRRDAEFRLGSENFDDCYYAHDCGIPYERNEHWLAFFSEVADRIVKSLKPASALDAGCAFGFLVEQLWLRGVSAYGVDISEYAISQAHESIAERVRVASLSKPIEGSYDLVTCVEVLEHMAADDARRAIENICQVTDRVLFSSSPDHYAEPTHVNVRPAESWSALFAAEGFFRNLEYDASYLTPWALLYERRPADPAELVRDYERVQARLEIEIRQLRSQVLQLSREQDEHEADQPRVADLEAEILRLRDELIGLDAEAGKARGEREYFAAQLAGQEQLALELQAVTSSRAWRLTRKLVEPANRLRQFLRR
jgi:SAM-dependent methyltransferase